MIPSLPCPVCDYPTPPGWLVCEWCSFEVPFTLWRDHVGAAGLAHARNACGYPPAEISRCQDNERQASKAIVSYLKQHGSALL